MAKKKQPAENRPKVNNPNVCGLHAAVVEQPITDTLELKLEAFACHKSQFAWLGSHTGDNSLLDDVRDTARIHGKACRCRYAEAFQRCNQSLRMTANRLLP